MDSGFGVAKGELSRPERGSSAREIVMPTRGDKHNGAAEIVSDLQPVQIKLDPRIVEALKQESDARGGHQERRILEEALSFYLGLTKAGQTKANEGVSKGAVSFAPKYSRIVE